MMRFIKVVALAIGIIIVVLAGAIGYGLYKFKYFPEKDMAEERISSDAKELSGYIRRIVSFGPRNPGTVGEARTRDYILQKFTEYGLKSDGQEEFEINMYHPYSWRLILSDKGNKETVEVPCSYMPFSASTGKEGITAPLAYVGLNEDLEGRDLRGKIVAYDFKFKPKGLKTYKKILFFYDPDDTLESSGRVVRPALEFEYQMYQKLRSKGAVGMVGLLSGLQWDSDQYYPQMSFGLEKSLPGVWVRPSQCGRVKTWANKTGATGTLLMTSREDRGTTANICAVLPGQIDEYYLVFSQHDTYFDGAVQDASGVAVVLALAKHFAGTNKPLQRGIIFMTLPHTNGRVGEKAFIEKHRNGLLRKTALVMAVEHIGRELDPQENLGFKVSDRPSFRMFFTSLNQNINGMVKTAILKQDYKRSTIIPQWLVEKITGKARGIAGEFYEAGIPVIGMMSNPPYMFFPEDRPDAVATDQLVPTANLMASIIRTADGFSFEELR
ncbi:MAG: M28 family peptidase [Deltaproteobacteria bacterium]|nr:M28 family peptidase [Deltaproteobacteria bacterium]